MPVYDYKCTNCPEVVEDVTVTLDELDIVGICCPECGCDCYRLIGNNGGFRLKGSCWSGDGYSRTYGDKLRFQKK